MRNTWLIVMSVLLITATFAFVYGLWSVVIFWINLIILFFTVVLVMYIIGPAVNKAFYWLHVKKGFNKFSSWFACVATWIFMFYLFSKYFELLGWVSDLSGGLVNLSRFGNFIPALITFCGIFIATLVAIFGHKKTN